MKRSTTLLLGMGGVSVSRAATPWFETEAGVTPIGPILGLIGVIAANALFTAGETALETLRASHIRQAREVSAERADALQRLIESRPRYSAACIIGSYLARIALVVLAFVAAPPVAAVLSRQANFPPNFGTFVAGALVLVLPAAFLNIVVGELLPRAFATVQPMRTALALGGFIRASALILTLVAAPVAWFANLVAARFGGRASLAGVGIAEEEIKNLVESAEETGEIERDEKELLHSVFEFSDTVAREVMTPRVDLDALPVRSEPREVADLIEQSGHSRIPLYEDTDDQIVGIIHAKDLFMAMLKGGPVNLRRLMRPPLFVPEMKTLHELLQEMRQHKSQLAVVQDEYGGTAGIVTIEDIVEELVGDIVDEYDNEQPDVSGDDGLWTVNGKAHWSDVNYAIGSRFSSDEFDTVGGLVFGLFGRQPKSGEWIDADGYRIEVAKTDGRRILELAIRKLEPEEILLGDAQESA